MKQLIQDRQLFMRRIFLMCYDMLAVFVASMFALIIRFDLNFYNVPTEYLNEVWRTLPYMMVITLIIFWALRLYSSLWSYAGALEMMYVVSACILDAMYQSIRLASINQWHLLLCSTKLLYFIWVIFTCADHGMQIFLSWT